jgi:hypothetical protein
MENGLEAISKKFKSVEKIYLLEFIDNDRKLLVIGGNDSNEEKLKLIIWNMYSFEESETPMDLDNFLKKDNIASRLARTSGNLLKIDNSGKVSSVIKKNEKKEEEVHDYEDKRKNFKQIKTNKEPWVSDDYEANSYFLCDRNIKGEERETLRLIVGRTTVQIWHQITSNDKNKSKDELELPNKGEPFLEFIWTNGIPENQEGEETRLQIEKFEHGPNNDFYLKVYWHERDSQVMEKDREEKKNQMERKEKEIRWQDVPDIKVDAVRHACKALEFINERARVLVNYTKKHLVSVIIYFANSTYFLTKKPN